ncbi:metallophosphoesterase [bacterium]|nr:metallophosphoesterase [bacterium]
MLAFSTRLTAAALLVALATGPPAASAPAAPAGGADVVLSEGFEGQIPDLHTYRATYAGDTLRAHTGEHSLRVTPVEGSGGAYFRLGGLVDGHSDYEFSVWVWAAKTGGVQLYVSASDGKQRHTKAQSSGGVAGQWSLITGELRGDAWRATDRDVMLAMVTAGESWFDDAVLRQTRLPQPPIKTYPPLAARLRARAAEHTVTLPPGGEVSLDGRAGVLAAGFEADGDLTTGAPTPTIPADGLLAFAVDAPRAMYVTGALELEPDGDLRPGLRATVLCDDTVIGAPMVSFPAGWQSDGNALTGPAPQVVGEPPPVRTELASWLMPAGRHTIMVAGPHFRTAGRFVRLQLRSLDRATAAPLYQFALLSDTHLGEGQATWMNNKLDGPAQAQLAATLADLRAENTRFALLAGDMTNQATRSQFEALGRVCAESGMRVYGCIGNHDAYLSTSRPDALSLCAPLFSSGATDYAFTEGPLRFIVLDGSYWRHADGTLKDYYDPKTARGVAPRPEQVQWLRDTLAADPRTPALFVWHYPLHSRGGLSSCGYRLPGSATGAEVLATLAAAPNVRGALCGHTHWNEFSVVDGQAHLVNPSFCEWPNAYRVFRVYPDHVEWELRQVRNRGFVRESFVPRKALSWMISTAPGDLTGEFSLQ